MQVSSDKNLTGAVEITINNQYTADIYPAGYYNRIDWENSEECLLGDTFRQFDLKSGDNSRKAISIEKSTDGTLILRLKETIRYTISLNINNDQKEKIELPEFQNQNNRFLKIEQGRDSVNFQFVNYLGRSKIKFALYPDGSYTFPFEVVPDKIDYEKDYIALTESIADHCAELLLEYSGTTSNLYQLSEDEHKTLLEQFIFLRKFCYSENINSLFEEIKRNPDRILTEENQWSPIGTGRPAGRFYTHPFSYGRNWGRYNTSDGTGHYYMPQMIVTEYKRDSFDTPANRFLKFALETFNNICEELVLSLDNGKKPVQAECKTEAQELHEKISDILRDSFFDEIGAMDIMPQNNQVLQKREGYSQIFHAYSMIDLALQLNWPGAGDVYQGESKNIALLYEYWLFFELSSIISSDRIPGCEKVNIEDDESRFLKNSDDGLVISLEQGKTSRQSFLFRNYGIRINLYYNLTFEHFSFSSTDYEGSYSGIFRPDYTIAFYPEKYTGKNGEKEALKNGDVSYIHFDAKYRLTDIKNIMGSASETSEEQEEEIRDEKADEAINVYKRGDLLKMHTYNDAIRRTNGSYILYPGNAISKGKYSRRFRVYDEIIPGVGAFAIKPENASYAEAEIASFIKDILISKSESASRLNRLRYYEQMVILEPALQHKPVKKKDQPGIKLNKDTLCLLGYLRTDYFNCLKTYGFFKDNQEFLFYYYAIKDGNVYSHHHDISKCELITFYRNHINTDNEYQLEPFVCQIESSELISRENLVKELNGLGCKTSENEHSADYYYAIRVRVISECESEDRILSADFINSQNGNDSFSPYSPKVLKAEEIPMLDSLIQDEDK